MCRRASGGPCSTTPSVGCRTGGHLFMSVSFDALVAVLGAANGTDRQSSQQAEAQLLAWDTERGFYYLLQLVYLATSLPVRLRWLAVICFKNGVERHWRSGRPSLIDKEEKRSIRARAFSSAAEKNNQLAIQNAHAVARMVRFDFPSEWPLLFDDVARQLEVFVFDQNDPVSTYNLLVTLNQVVKTVAMVRIGRARHAMQSKMPMVTPVLVRLYVKFFQEWTRTGDSDLSVLQLCYMCLKNLRRIIPEGYDRPHDHSDVVDFIKITIDHLQVLVVRHESLPSDLLERFVKCYCKVYLGLINTNPTSFILLPCAPEILQSFLALLQQKAEAVYNSSEDDDFWELLAVKGLLILKKMTGYLYKRGAVTLRHKNDREEVSAAISRMSQLVLTPPVVRLLCDLIIDWYLRIKPSDLDSWLVEPEEWCNEELLALYEFQARPCAENLFQDLIKYFREDVGDFVLAKISSDLANHDVLVKDAILCTFQLSAVSIADAVDFDRLLVDVFVPLARDNHPEAKILRRRVSLICREWVPVKCSPQGRVAVYELLRELLQDSPANDKVVRLTAVHTLKVVVEDWDFVKTDFAPFLNELVTSCLALLRQLLLPESKLFVLTTLSVLIERCNPHIDPNTLTTLTEVVPAYWNETSSDNELILKNALLRLLRSLTIALNDSSASTHSLSLPLVRACCSSSSELYTLLSEDGYELWLVLVQFSPANSQHIEDILQLFPLLEYGLANATEIMPVIVSIMRSYALLAPHVYCSDVGAALLRILAGYLPSLRDDSFVIFVSLMDILAMAMPADDGFLDVLVTSGLLRSMVAFVLDEKQSIQSINKVVLPIARIAVASAPVFFRLMEAINADLNRVVETWLGYFNNNGNPRNKKLSLLALLSIFATGILRRNVFFVEHFATVTKMALYFTEEVNETDTGNCDAYNEHTYEDLDHYTYLDADIRPHGEAVRFMDLERSDPARTQQLKLCLASVFSNIRSSLSEPEFQQLVSLGDEYSTERLQTLA